MKRARSIYADLYCKGSYRSRYSPRIDRHRRPHVIAWAGPAAFYPNRFYNRDNFYKARIDKPEKLPQLHIIDPANFSQTLAERLKVEEAAPVNIGFAKRSFDVASKKNGDVANLERLARKKQLMVDLSLIDHSSLSILEHFQIFDHLFGARVFFYITQRMRISFDSNIVYNGNVLHAEDTKLKPNVQIESLGGGFTTLLAVNLDGNPFVANSEVIHWMVSNIPDGGSIDAGFENIPYLQVLPFKGTGYHRLVFLLFRHDKALDFSLQRLKSFNFADRTFCMRQFYKNNEEVITPCSIAFVQTLWDDSVTQCLHEIGLKSPIYQYEYNRPLKMVQKEFPNKAQPFDLYLDQFRDPVEMTTEVFKERLSMRDVGKNPEQPKYPDIDYQENKKKLPFWQHSKLIKKNSGAGRYYALWNNPID